MSDGGEETRDPVTPTDDGLEDEHEIDPAPVDAVVATRMFLFVGSAVGVMSLVYLLTDDDAGQMMLGVASLLALVCGVYLWIHRVRYVEGDTDGVPATGEHGPQYLPHASIWPFWIGVAAFLLTNGLILGTWFLVPGAVLMVIGLVGFIGQSRVRG